LSGEAGDAVRSTVIVERRCQEFLTWLEQQEYRCPDDVQVRLVDFDACPDLIYRLPTGPVAVFVDNADNADRPGRDEETADDLRDGGWSVVRIPHDAEFSVIVGKYPSVFGVSRREHR
jgi:hypothetical protein